MDLAIEEMSLSGWPALQTEVYDGWLLRFAEGWTKRSNSVNPLYASTIELGGKIRDCEKAYASRGLPTVFKILGSEAHEELDAALAERGYARIDETAVRTLDLSELRGSAGAAAPGRAFEAPGDGAASAAVGLSERFEDAWVDAFCACSRSEARRGTIGRILAKVSVDKLVAAASAGGGILGCGYGALERDWVGLFDIVVREEERRKGHGERIVRAILGGAAAKGARKSYLQVVSGNAPAERLYSRLGFSEAYRYWYRRKDSS